jgi:hypothetical protein
MEDDLNVLDSTIQIIPANGWYLACVMMGDKGLELDFDPLVAWALVRRQYKDRSGGWEKADDSDNIILGVIADGLMLYPQETRGSWYVHESQIEATRAQSIAIIKSYEHDQEQEILRAHEREAQTPIWRREKAEHDRREASRRYAEERRRSEADQQAREERERLAWEEKKKHL